MAGQETHKMETQQQEPAREQRQTQRRPCRPADRQ
jgi:hypothetical protein